MVVVLAAIAGLGVMWMTRGPTTTRPSPGIDAAGSASSADADVAQWIRSNLPLGAKLLTNGHPAPAGFRTAPLERPDQDWHSFDYFLTNPDPGPGIDASADATVARVWQSSVPVAVFPNMQVRRILVTPLDDDALRTLQVDRAERLAAGMALLSNPAVTASPQVRARLASGALDLAAAATVSVLAGSMPVYLAAIEDVAAEAAAGMPARAMTVQVTDAGRATLVLSGLSAALRPDQVAATPEGIFRLHWPLRFTPLPSVH